MTNATPARRCCVALRRAFSAQWLYEKLKPNEPDHAYLFFLLNRVKRYKDLAEAISIQSDEDTTTFFTRANRIKREVYNRRGRLANQSN